MSRQPDAATAQALHQHQGDPVGTGPRPVDRFEWERAVLRTRWAGVIKGNAAGTRGGISGAVVRAVAWAIVSHADRDGANVWPGDTRVAELSEVGVKNVKTVRAALVRFGFLTRTGAGFRRERGTDTYQLTLPAEVPSPEAPSQSVHKGGPVDPGYEGGKRGPLDPVHDRKRGPVDPRYDAVKGVHRTPDTPVKGVHRTRKRGPLDPHTNTDHVTTTTTAAAEPHITTGDSDGRPSLPPGHQVVADTLADMAPTGAELDAVVNAWIEAAKPRGIGLYRTIAGDGGIPWRTILTTIRAEAVANQAAALKDRIAELRRGPTCPHGEPGGQQPHPETGKPLCASCRHNIPPDDLGPNPIDTYRAIYRAAHNRNPTPQRMAAVARQADHMRRQGADNLTTSTVATAAAIADHDLVEHFAAKDKISA